MSNLTPLLEIAKELLKPAGNKGMHEPRLLEDEKPGEPHKHYKR